MVQSNEELRLTQIQSALHILSDKIHSTPVYTNSAINELSSHFNFYFKCENLQKTGAFKIRGATYALDQLIHQHGIEELKKKGVITFSGGNHAQALSLASKRLSVPCTIVMPNNCSKVKKQAVIGYGAVVLLSDPDEASSINLVNQVIKKTGAYFIHPSNDRHVACGQGTLALEFTNQVESMDVKLDAIIVPIGGGGLLAGTCVAVKELNENIKVIAAEPKGADDLYKSIQSGNYKACSNPDTIADGLRCTVGDLNFPIIKRYIDGVFTCSDHQIIKSMQLIWERMKLIVEPSGAVPLAVALYNQEFQEKFKGLKNVGIILTGGNVDLADFFDFCNK
ncbi:pyridoxal-5'-phosphate-dependent enzyme, beta subunit [Neoconidiobolus thromboides FSU 785]|nr:pyridoxal-5'-phosphate-dependent enzyme, beta subunit [Neoconidiobolus thromboides FSU 785]